MAERIAERRWEIRWQCGFPAASGVVGKAGWVGNTAEPCPLWGAVATLTAGRRSAEATSLMGPVVRPAVWLEADSGALDGMRGVTPGWSGALGRGDYGRCMVADARWDCETTGSWGGGKVGRG